MQTTFEANREALDLMAELRTKLGVRSNADVLRKAIALAAVAARYADEDYVLTIIAPDGHTVLVSLRT